MNRRRITAALLVAALATLLAGLSASTAHATHLCVATSSEPQGHTGDYICVELGPKL